jgi:hypothetical protein
MQRPARTRLEESLPGTDPLSIPYAEEQVGFCAMGAGVFPVRRASQIATVILLAVEPFVLIALLLGMVAGRGCCGRAVGARGLLLAA